MININKIGKYKQGLTKEEVKEYLWQRVKGYPEIKVTKDSLYKQFCKLFLGSTCPIAEDGTFLIFRHDVKRFADAIFEERRTYFD